MSSWSLKTGRPILGKNSDNESRPHQYFDMLGIPANVGTVRENIDFQEASVIENHREWRDWSGALQTSYVA